MSSSNVTGNRLSQAEMPMPGGDDQRRLIEAFDNDATFYKLYLQLPKLADELERNDVMKRHAFSVVETVKALRKSNSWSMCELLHSIPHVAVKSIISGTVAHDIENKRFPCYEIPFKNAINKDQIPGVYVVSISRYKDTPHGRDNLDGRFLNIKEMKLLINGLRMYIRGYRVHVQFQEDLAAGTVTSVKDLSPADADALDHVKKVDALAKLGNQSADPIFIKKESHVDKTKALIRTLGRMCDTGNDPTENVRMKQTPLYVGCSKDLGKRTQVYNQANGSVKDINKPLGLTISVLRKLNLDVKVHVRVVLKTWKPDQLAMAEQLVTTLAGSLVFQYGFNATESGGTGPNTVTSGESLRLNTEDIMWAKKSMQDNLKNTLGDLNNRQSFLEDLDKVQLEARQIADTIKRCGERLKHLPDNMEWNENLDQLKELLVKLRKDLEEREQTLEFLNLLLDIQEIVFKATGKPVIRLTPSGIDSVEMDCE
ncbi:hypothetical protein F53441_10105 [Fusarium austroafricanum]|uniref:Uncharacterized protein n=1 Tax=Fusarium austroafricanum TaxID=2364996 RepID=A0A8H4NSM2_9HYPO|nr:hypothetical protein F53441_10105 [Fusarium austroafricanum]